MKSFRRITAKHIGIGGVACPCCRDGSKKEARKACARAVRRYFKKEIQTAE
jgi:hypothetical protein